MKRSLTIMLLSSCMLLISCLNSPDIFDQGNDHDQYGIFLKTKDVTNKGLTLAFEQFGDSPTDELHTGAWYSLEISDGNEWKPVDTKKLDHPIAWNSIAYAIPKDELTELKVNWEWLYGELDPGFYRISKEIMDLRKPGNFDKKIYRATFAIENNRGCMLHKSSQ